ncbi:amino acid permease [Aphelenchoides avenae]|nr:amino acid permease [Aphelenchus avenae]
MSFVIPVLVCMLMVGSLNSTIFAASRFLHAAAKKGFLPTFISCTNPQTDSPRAALIVHVILVFGMTFVGNVEELIDYAGFAQWSQRATTMLVLFWIRSRHSEDAKGATVHPPWIIPLLFFLTCSSLVLTTLVNNMHVAGMSLIILLSAVVIYFFFLYRRGLRAWTPYAEWSSKFDYCTTAAVQVVLNVMPQRTFVEETSSITATTEKDSRESSLKKRKVSSRSSKCDRVAPAAVDSRPKTVKY